MATDLRTAAQQALEAMEAMQSYAAAERKGLLICDESIIALRAALEQPEQEAHWLTKKLMADYLDMIAEAISENSTEMLRHKAHWMRRGQV
jgi:hypothetical protein